MHPVSTVFFIGGYLLAVPVAARMSAVVAKQHRLALVGHQVGVGLALLGWALRGRMIIVLIHVAWMVGVRIWFESGRRSRRLDV